MAEKSSFPSRIGIKHTEKSKKMEKKKTEKRRDNSLNTVGPIPDSPAFARHLKSAADILKVAIQAPYRQV